MGGVAHVTIADVKQSNGVIYVIDKVLLRKMWSGAIPSSERQATLEGAGLFSFIVERLPNYMFGRTAMSRTSLSSPVIGPTSVAAPVSRLTV